MKLPSGGSSCQGFDGIELFCYPDEVMEGHTHVEQGAEGDWYLLLLIMLINSDDKAITLAKGCI